MLDAPAALPLFAYGDLLDETRIGYLLEHPVETQKARLPDFEVVELSDKVPPIVVESPGQFASGTLYRRLAPEDYARLDAYVGVMQGLYRRVKLEVVLQEQEGEVSRAAFVYLPI